MIGLILVIALGLLLMGYFNISIKSVIQSPTVQSNFSYVGGEVKTFWNSYLAKPANYLWKDVFINIFWQSFISNMERIRDNKPTDIQLYAPQVPLPNQ